MGLTSLQWAAPDADLDWKLGVCNCVCPGPWLEAQDDELVTQIRDNTTGRVCDLPSGFQPRVGEVGSTWFVRENYDTMKARLFCQTEGNQVLVQNLFQEAAHAQANVHVHVRG